VQVHHGTRESAARVVPLGGGRQSSAYVQLRLESPLLCLPRDRLVVRRVAPPATIGGAVVLDATPRRHGPSVALAEHLRRLERGEVPSQPPAAASPPPAPNGWAGVPAERLALVAEVLEGDGLEPRPDVRLARDLELAPAELKAALDHLVRNGAAVRVGPSQHFGAAALERAGGEVADLCRRQGSVTIASARDELSTSRKYAQAVLEYLDRTRVTRRVGDEHVLRGSR
jgi:selenocysteine-specific elongation factor